MEIDKYLLFLKIEMDDGKASQGFEKLKVKLKAKVKDT